MTTKPSAEVLRAWIDLIQDQPSRPLSKWEEAFVESVSEQLEERGTLSARQVDVLERIYAEKTS